MVSHRSPSHFQVSSQHLPILLLAKVSLLDSICSFVHMILVHLRTACDLMNALFVIDEYTDLMNENETQAIADIVMDALRNPLVARPPGESIIGEMMMQCVMFSLSIPLFADHPHPHSRFWARAIKDARVSAQRRFISTFDTYMQSVVQQAADRAENHVRDVDTYFENRRENVAVRPGFALLEFDMELPDEVLEHPVIVDLTTHCIDMITADNVRVPCGLYQLMTRTDESYRT